MRQQRLIVFKRDVITALRIHVEAVAKLIGKTTRPGTSRNYDAVSRNDLASSMNAHAIGAAFDPLGLCHNETATVRLIIWARPLQ